MELSFKDAYVHFRTFSNDEPLNTSIEYINQSALLTDLCISCIDLITLHRPGTKLGHVISFYGVNKLV